jgi:hypothetical protein
MEIWRQFNFFSVMHAILKVKVAWCAYEKLDIDPFVERLPSRFRDKLSRSLILQLSYLNASFKKTVKYMRGNTGNDG